jgi:hypothetical protein
MFVVVFVLLEVEDLLLPLQATSNTAIAIMLTGILIPTEKHC